MYSFPSHANTYYTAGRHPERSSWNGGPLSSSGLTSSSTVCTAQVIVGEQSHRNLSMTTDGRWKSYSLTLLPCYIWSSQKPPKKVDLQALNCTPTQALRGCMLTSQSRFRETRIVSIQMSRKGLGFQSV
jgi:hypothetical protein